MSDTGMPSGGFRWVQPAGEHVDPRRRRLRWQWVALVCAAVMVVAAGVAAVHWWPRGGDGAASRTEDAPIGTPKDRLIRFALNRQPVPAWRVTDTDLGLPAGSEIGHLFAGVGDKAYFVSLLDDGGRVYGLDTTTGKPLYPAIELPGWYGGTCSANGPAVAVCVTHSCRAGITYCQGRERVWVIDLERGAVTFTGEPKAQEKDSLDEYHPGRPILTALGPSQGVTWLVGAVKGKGVYGVGPQGEPTWFLPGSGDLVRVANNDPIVDDIAPLTLGIQSPDAASGHDLRVFSVDGRDLTPTPAPGLRVADAQVYVGGFAVEFDKDSVHQGVGLYDGEGRQLAMLTDAYQTLANAAMPLVVQNKPDQNLGTTGLQVYTAAGKPQVQLSASMFDTFRMIGTKLYAGEPPGPWRSWDLFTGNEGPACAIDLRSYVGSDGTTIIWRNHIAGSVDEFVAVDPPTCHTLWKLPVDTGSQSSSVLQKTGTSLLQLTGDAIVGLRAPI